MKCDGFVLLLLFFRSLFKNRMVLAVENLALRQQLSVLKAKKKRPRLNCWDREFWSFLSGCWPDWCIILAIVQPATVIGWHRKIFKVYWTLKSKRQKRHGRPKVSKEIQKLISRMTRENSTRRVPRIQKEMANFGYEVSEASVYKSQGEAAP